MSIYQPPLNHNGFLNSTFNPADYIQTNKDSENQASNDARYLRNSGIVVSNAMTTFDNTVNLESLAKINLLNAKRTTGTLTPYSYSTTPSFNFENGLVYTITSESATATSMSFTNIPNTPLKSYIFTFIIRPSTPTNPWYFKTPSVIINGVSTELIGLDNVALPASYTFIVQQVSILNYSSGASPFFIALTSCSAY